MTGPCGGWGEIGVPKREWVDDWSHAPSTAQPK